MGLSDVLRAAAFSLEVTNLCLRERIPGMPPYLTQRICGMCSSAHAIAAAIALEQAAGVEIPRNAVILRNLILGADIIQNHVRHFT